MVPMRIMASLMLLVVVSVSAAVQPSKTYIKPLSQFPGFRTVARSGRVYGANNLPLGTNVDKTGKPIAVRTPVCNTNNTDGVPQCYAVIANATDYEISHNPDFTSYFNINGQIYMITQFESSNPATAWVVKLSVSPSSGEMNPVWAKPVDWSAPELMGLWIPCAGSVSPWKSHLGSEEYEPDAFCVATATSFTGPESTALSKCTNIEAIVSMMRYFFPSGNFTINDVKNTSIFQPYMYGVATEIKLLGAGGAVSAHKHMAMGRHSFELYLVMPDNKTVYSTDDGTNTAFWKFVMDTPSDLSSGTLYGAKLTQTSDSYGGDFTISWIELGKGNTSGILAMIKGGITFFDIFEVAAFNASAGVGAYCPTGFKSISKRDNGFGASCLKLKPGMEAAAAFLESRRYLAYLNGTVELSKFEGITLDPTTKTMYAAMSQIRYGMEDNKAKGSASTTYDIGGPNDVRLPYNPCGAIYAIDLDASYSATRMYGELAGTPVSGSRFAAGLGSTPGFINKCLTLSEPDNVVFVPGHNMLVIGEDQNENKFDYMYTYDLATKTQTRIFSSNFGSETTSPYWFPNLAAGWSYLGAAIQHPYDESDQGMLSVPGNTGVGAWIGNWAFRASDFATGDMLRFLPIPTIKTNASGAYGTASSSAYKISKDDAFSTITQV